MAGFGVPAEELDEGVNLTIELDGEDDGHSKVPQVHPANRYPLSVADDLVARLVIAILVLCRASRWAGSVRKSVLRVNMDIPGRT